MGKMLKKTIFTLALEGWEPEICDITFPLFKVYAAKLDADFYVIKDRKFPDWTPSYEKMQIYQLGKEMENDWNIYIDADALIHPETIDWTNYIPKDTVAHNACDMAAIRWHYDHYFLRDGRNIGSCNWLAIGSDWCLDFWHPVEDLTQKDVEARIFPIVDESLTVKNRRNLTDDYVMGRNIARYGLKFIKLMDIEKKLGFEGSEFFWHDYLVPPEEKLAKMKETVTRWKLT